MKFNQSTYNVTENSGIIQLFLVLSNPSSFNETIQLINIDIDTDTSTDGMYDELLIALLSIMMIYFRKH